MGRGHWPRLRYGRHMSPAEFEATIASHRPSLTRFAGHLFGQDAPDVVQAALANVVKQRANDAFPYEPEAERAPVWLRRAVRWAGLAMRRQRGRSRRREGQVGQAQLVQEGQDV